MKTDMNIREPDFAIRWISQFTATCGCALY